MLRRLLPEFVAARALLKLDPEQNLGEAHFLPQLTRPPYLFDRLPEDARAPSTSLRLVPLPVPGRICIQRRHHILNTPNLARSGIGAFKVAAKASPSTSRVCAGSMMPSSHSRAVA
jgi:hypothetical protein